MNIRKLFALLLAVVLTLALGACALAETAAEPVVAAGEVVTAAADTTTAKAISAAALMGIACAVGALGMAMAICKASESISRQPEAEGPIRTAMMLGLVFIETAIIYALIIAILIIFVL